MRTITEALRLAPPGARIVVRAGRYAEPTLRVERPVTIVGEGMPTLDGENAREIMVVTASDVTVRGLRFAHVGTAFTEDRAALRVREAGRCTVTDNRFDVVFGGGRRDEEKARAKERVLSLRDEFGQWDPRNQRPELWNLYNGRHRPGEHVRAFPLSNWTELDVWRYIEREGIELPGLYYAHEREVFDRDGMLLAVGPYSQPRTDAEAASVRTLTVRYRTVGDMSCTGAVESDAVESAPTAGTVVAVTTLPSPLLRASAWSLEPDEHPASPNVAAATNDPTTIRTRAIRGRYERRTVSRPARGSRILMAG